MSHAENKVTQPDGDPSALGSGGLVRVLAEDGYHCSAECPYLARWEHPFWHHTAWCWRNLVDLKWHDYWMADCTDGDASPTMEKVRNAGRTKRPNVAGQTDAESGTSKTP